MTDELDIPVGHVPTDDASTDEPDAPHAAPVGAVDGPRTAGRSLLGNVHGAADHAVRAATRDLPVGKIAGLYARYRALTDDEQATLEARVRQRQRLRRKVTRDSHDSQDERERAAMLLVVACVELLWVDNDGALVPLHEALAVEEGVEVNGPLRYNAETIEVLQLGGVLGLELDGPRPPSSVEVAMALHRWGQSHAPLLTNARALSMWMSGVSAETFKDLLEGM